MATHSRILALRIPWIEEPGRLQFMGLQKIQIWLGFHNKNDVTERDWSTLDKNDLQGDHSKWRIRGPFPQSSCELVKFLTACGAQGTGGGEPQYNYDFCVSHRMGTSGWSQFVGGEIPYMVHFKVTNKYLFYSHSLEIFPNPPPLKHLDISPGFAKVLPKCCFQMRWRYWHAWQAPSSLVHALWQPQMVKVGIGP